MARVLAVDDDSTVRLMLKTLLEREGHHVTVFESGEALLDDLHNQLPDILVLDIQLPGMDGLDLLEETSRRLPSVPALMLTADTGVDSVVEAMRRGAYDYLSKPIEPTELATSIRNATERLEMAARLARLEREVDGRGFPGIIGRSRPMYSIFDQIDRVAPSDVSVLVRGESGTGKELVAQAIHDRGARSNAPFVAVNCAAIPEQLQESELFGHERGAFTGATNRRIGRFEEADGGTLFLDEIGDLSLEAQAKVLRAIQERRFRRVGGTSEIRSDFRLASATHRDLDTMIPEGLFREDLFFRLAVYEMQMPPLRRRREDIPLLAQHFIEQFAEGTPPGIATPAMAALLGYPWPGNVRELQNAIQRALVTSDSEIRLSDLPARVRRGEGDPYTAQTRDRSAPGGRTPDSVAAREPSDRHSERDPEGSSDRWQSESSPYEIVELTELERRAIVRALEITRGNITEAAQRLGIGRTTLYRKMEKYGLR